MHRVTNSVLSHTQRLLRARFAAMVVLAIPFIVLVAIACTKEILAPDSSSVPESPATVVSDGSHSGGNSHFFFLPPLVGQPTVSGVSDGHASPTVLVCEWNAALGPAGQCTRIIAQFSRATGTGAEIVSYDAAAQQYKVNWQTNQCIDGPCALDPRMSYRLRVLIAATELGYADIQVAANGSQLKNVSTNEYIGLVDGRTLPIKFRIEQGALSLVAPGDGASIGTAGGKIATDDGKVALSIPAGALATSTDITIKASTEQLPGTGAWATPVILGPDGTTFAQPVRLTLSYDASKLPEGVTPDALKLSTWVDDHWEVVPGSTLNIADATVSADIAHFSFYGISIWPNASYNNTTQQVELTKGQRTTLTGYTYYVYTYPQTSCWPAWTWVNSWGGGYWTVRQQCVTYTQSYSYPTQGVRVSWLSSAPSVASLGSPGYSVTDANGQTRSPPITALTVGSTNVTGSASGVTTSPARVTVLPSLVLMSGHGNGAGLFPDSLRELGVYQGFGLYATIPAALATDLTVNITHRNPAILPGLNPTSTIAAGSLRASGLSVIAQATGVDTIIATAPGYGPDTIIMSVGIGHSRVVGWPVGLTIGDSAAIRIEPMDPSDRYNDGGYSKTYALDASTNLRFTDGTLPISSIRMTDGTYSTGTFYVTAVGPGTGTLNVTEPNSRTTTVTVPIAGQPLVMQPRTATNVAGWSVRQQFGVAVAMATDLNVSLTNANTFVVIGEGGTSNYTYGGQTGHYVLAAGTTAKDLIAAGLSGPGVDTLIAAAPGMLPDTAIITLVQGVLRVDGWPTALRVGDSAALQLTVTDDAGRPGNLALPIDIALGPSTGLALSDGRTPISAVHVQQRTSATFYVKATASGTQHVDFNHRDYVRRSLTVDVPQVPLVFSVFGTGTNPFRKFGFRQGTGLVSIIPAPLAAPLTVTLTHTNTSVASSNPTAVVGAGRTSEGVTLIAGEVAGRDTIIGTAPGYTPDTLVVETALGRISVDGWPSSLAYGDSAAIRIHPTNEDGFIDNAWLTSFALGSNGKLSFSSNSVPITSIAVPDGSSSTPVFYVKAVGAGSGIMSVANSWYITSPYEVPIVGGFVSIQVAPDPAGVIPGGTVQLTGTARNAAGNPVSGVDLSWSSANNAVATVDANGVVTGVANGTVIVTASSGGVSGSATVRVGTPSISASPGSLTLPVQQGQSAQAQINITNGGGGVLSGLQAGSFSNYFNGSPAPWVTASWNTTTAPATLTITAAPGLSIPAGVHQLRFDVSAPGASNSPYTFYSINITVIAAGVTPVNATISPTPGSVSFNVTLGQSAQAQIAINNSGTDPLTNLTAGPFSNYFNGSPAQWVTAAFNTTTAPATLTITAAPDASVPLGTHQLRFEVMSPGATNSPYTFYSINVTVTEPPFRLGSIDGAGGFTCATTIQNAAYCWGSNGGVGTLGLGITNNNNYPTPTAVVGGLSFTTVSTDAGHTCALTLAGAAYCWGYGSDTRLGTGIDQGSNAPVAVAGGHTFVQIDVGDNHACAVDNLQQAYCWGYGMLGNLANTASASSRGNSSVPTLVLGGVQFLRVAAGGNFTCGIAADQTAYCWGLNSVGQLGAPSPTTYNCDPYTCSLLPTAVSGGLQLQSISAGSQHACGVTTGGDVYCWGGNGSGQLGDGSTINSPVPVRVGGVFGATQVDAGNAHSCARTGSGQLYCWGANDSGQLGRGNQIGSPTAGLVSGSGMSFLRVTAGGSHSCAITSVGSAYCWGANANGQLGIGSVTAPRTVPTLVAAP